MIPEALREVLTHDGVVAIATLGPDGPHLVNTYVRISEDERLLIPAGSFHKTESNIASNNQVLLTMRSNKVRGFHGPGTGFLIKGTAAFIKDGPEMEAMKGRFAWARAVLAVTIGSATQTL